MDLEFTVNSQVLKRTDSNTVVNLSENYLQLCFSFSDDWDGLSKFVMFQDNGNIRLPLVEDKITVPSSLLSKDRFVFSLYGVDSNVTRITTNKVRVYLLDSGYAGTVVNDVGLDIVEYIFNNLSEERTYLDTELDKKANASDVESSLDSLNALIVLKADSDDVAAALQSQANELTSLIDGKANSVHTHTASQVTDIDNVLESQASELTSLINGKADSVHTHTTSDVTDFPQNVSEFTNDSEYLSNSQVNNLLNELRNELNNRVVLKSNKDIIQTNESTDFVAYVIEDGIPISNASVSFIQRDYLLYSDNGIADDCNDNIWSDNNTFVIDREYEYTTLTEATENSSFFYALKYANSADGGFEFDYMQVDGLASHKTLVIRCGQSESNVCVFSINDFGGEVGVWYHVKITINNDDTITVKANDNEVVLQKSVSCSDYRIAFTSPDTCTTIRYKNLHILQNREIDDVLTNTVGIATLNNAYTGVGGDRIDFIAKSGNLKSEAYSVMDYPIYDSNEYSKTGAGSASTSVTNEISFDNTKDWEFTCDMQVTGNACRLEIVSPSEERRYYIGIGKNTQGKLVRYLGTATGTESSFSYSDITFEDDTYYSVKIIKQEGKFSFYFNNGFLASPTIPSWTDNYDRFCIKLTTWTTNTITIKNMRLKHI